MKLFWRLLVSGSVASCAVLLAGFLFSGCAAPEEPVFSSDPVVSGAPAGAPADAPAGVPAQTPPVSVDSDTFSLNDQVIVTFSDPQLPAHEERIKEDGTITLHLIGPVKAVGKTPGQLQKEIQGLYVPTYYQPGRFTVTVKSQERAYYVGGEVRNPNRYLYSGAITVTKAIQTAGDFTDFAKKTAVELTRAGSDKPIKVNVKKVLKDPRLDPPVFPGDKIHVPRRIL